MCCAMNWGISRNPIHIRNIVVDKTMSGMSRAWMVFAKFLFCLLVLGIKCLAFFIYWAHCFKVSLWSGVCSANQFIGRASHGQDIWRYLVDPVALQKKRTTQNTKTSEISSWTYLKNKFNLRVILRTALPRTSNLLGHHLFYTCLYSFIPLITTMIGS